MFAALGGQLRARRETLSLTMEEIERHIHVRAHYLAALESGEFSGLPSAVQTRGMLTNYATFLDLDVDAVLLQFADVLQARHRERVPEPPGARGAAQVSAPTRVPVLRGFIAPDLFGVVVIAVLAIISVCGVSIVMETSAATQPQATAPSISDVLLASPVSTLQDILPTSALLDLRDITSTPFVLDGASGFPTLPAGVNVQVNVVVTERTYLRVIVDGKVAFDGRATAGTAYPFDAVQRIEILAGNAAALRVTFNQRELGILGDYGEVINLIYTVDGALTPTATLAATATVTQTPTITPSVTRTPIPSLTPSLTATRVPSRTPTPP